MNLSFNKIFYNSNILELLDSNNNDKAFINISNIKYFNLVEKFLIIKKEIYSNIHKKDLDSTVKS